jgi:VWFA-related protein
MKSLVSVLLNMALVWTAVHAAPLGTQAQQQTEQTVTIGTSEVVLDVVVRDNKGRPVKDLAAKDFQVYEDGVKQDIQSFRLFQMGQGGESLAAAPRVGGEANRAGVGSGTARRNPFGDVAVLSLVFDRLSPAARETARKAAISYVSEKLKQDDLAGVFAIDLSLNVLQPYTSNAQLVSKAIDRIATLASAAFNSGAEQSRTISGQMEPREDKLNAAIGAASAGGPGSSGGSAAAAGAAVAELELARMTVRMLDTYETLERDEQGYATTNSLLAVINSLAKVEGRKAIVFFCEGLAIPPAVEGRFRAVINAANRANVSIYPVDAAGLRVESSLAESAKEINAMAAKRIRQEENGVEGDSGSRRAHQINNDQEASRRPMTKDLERNEDLLRLDPHSGLGQLADQTGGFLIKDTNNVNSGLARIDEDMRSHYVITYAPKNMQYDGRFRQISVKLGRPGLDVQSRKGYYAVRGAGSEPILDYEAPAIAALDGQQPKDSFPVHALALSFPEPKHPGLVPVLVEAPASAFTYNVDKEKNTYSADFSIVAIVKDQSDHVVGKLSQHYKLSGPADKLEAQKRGQILFYRSADLQPGNYKVEAIAYDAASSKTSVKTARVEVPEGGGANLKLSSVLVLKRVERLSAADQKMDNPFHFGEILIYPNMGEPLSKSTSKQLAFFFDVYPANGAAAAPGLSIEVIQNGKSLAQASPALPAADATGRIQYASALPLDGFQPGDYVLKITVVDGKTTVSRSAGFAVQP